MEDKKEKVEAALKVFKEKTKDLNNIKTMVTKISEERREEKEGINNLEDKVSEIKELLNPLIPTLGFAKECIEVAGGSNKLLDDLRAYKREEMLANMVARLGTMEVDNNDQIGDESFNDADIANAETAEREAAAWAAEEEEKRKREKEKQEAEKRIMEEQRKKAEEDRKKKEEEEKRKEEERIRE